MGDALTLRRVTEVTISPNSQKSGRADAPDLWYHCYGLPCPCVTNGHAESQNA